LRCSLVVFFIGFLSGAWVDAARQVGWPTGSAGRRDGVSRGCRAVPPKSTSWTIPGRAVRRCDAARIPQKKLVLDPISHPRTEVLLGRPNAVKGFRVTDSRGGDRLDPLRVCLEGARASASGAAGPSVRRPCASPWAGAPAITTPKRADPGPNAENGPHHHDPTRIRPMLGSNLEPRSTTQPMHAE
jgi:hypothetical protein